MFSIKGFKPRLYQNNILQTTKLKNTLVCLPTGTGKTKSAILLAIHQLNTQENSKVIIISPTKPLSNQICEEVKESTTIPPAQITLLTGTVKPEERKKFYQTAKVIVATPQTIANDITNNHLNLKDISLLVIDECHRSKQRYANTIVASKYYEQSTSPRILALTASPGATKEKVKEICENLFIEDVEIRTEQDEDIAPYIQEKNIQHIKIELPKEIKEARDNIKSVYLNKTRMLKSFGLTKPTTIINKKDLLLFQKRLQGEIKRGNRRAYAGISITAQAIKLSYMLELIETQTTNSLKIYIKKLQKETSKAAKAIVTDRKIIQTEQEIKKLPEHPKLTKLREIIKNMLHQNKNAKAIIFANYRATVDEIKDIIENIPHAKPTILVGQKLGFSQKEQLERIEKFNKNIYNILIGTSITEEGLSIGSLDVAIFYDHTGSEIRKIQRSGRVGRVKAGRIIYLIAKNTRDEALLWTSHRKEKKMHSLLKTMKKKVENQQKLM